MITKFWFAVTGNGGKCVSLSKVLQWRTFALIAHTGKGHFAEDIENHRWKSPRIENRRTLFEKNSKNHRGQMLLHCPWPLGTRDQSKTQKQKCPKICGSNVSQFFCLSILLKDLDKLFVFVYIFEICIKKICPKFCGSVCAGFFLSNNDILGCPSKNN